MDKKILLFDCETTGLDAKKNDIIQLAGMIIINGKIEHEFNFKMQPRSYEDISQKALDVHGMSIEDIKSFRDPVGCYNSFVAIMELYVRKYDKGDKFYPAGYNVSFDLDFVGQWFKKCGDKYGFGTWQNWNALDPLPYLRLLEFKKFIEPKNLKLETACEYFNININAHDAMSDVRATWELLKKALSNTLLPGARNDNSN